MSNQLNEFNCNKYYYFKNTTKDDGTVEQTCVGPSYRSTTDEFWTTLDSGTKYYSDNNCTIIGRELVADNHLCEKPENSENLSIFNTQKSVDTSISNPVDNTTINPSSSNIIFDENKLETMLNDYVTISDNVSSIKQSFTNKNTKTPIYIELLVGFDINNNTQYTKYE